MPISSPVLFETLVRAIPAEEDAALVAQVGERARITSRAGNIEIGSAVLTPEAIDELNARVFPPGQLRALKETGAARFELTLPGIDGKLTVLAASTPGDRWLEIRRPRAGADDDLSVPANLEFAKRNDLDSDGLTFSPGLLEEPVMSAAHADASSADGSWTETPEYVVADQASSRIIDRLRPRAGWLWRL